MARLIVRFAFLAFFTRDDLIFAFFLTFTSREFSAFSPTNSPSVTSAAGLPASALPGSAPEVDDASLPDSPDGSLAGSAPGSGSGSYSFARIAKTPETKETS